MNKLFYTYYDALFQEKDYAGEVRNVVECYRQHCDLPLQRMIEVGCGTGNHTREFASLVPEIVAVDIDEQMLSIARQKVDTNRVTFLHSRIEHIEDKVSLIAALFNVVTYLEDFSALEAFFEGVSHNLVPGGVCIFDAWNGIAAIRSLPQVKIGAIQIGGKKIKTTLTPAIDLMKQEVIVTYELEENQENTVIQKEQFSFLQKLWTPYEIEEYARRYHLRTVQLSPVNALNTTAGKDDWKVMYILQKYMM